MCIDGFDISRHSGKYAALSFDSRRFGLQKNYLALALQVGPRLVAPELLGVEGVGHIEIGAIRK